jgi:hypothetical protein
MKELALIMAFISIICFVGVIGEPRHMLWAGAILAAIASYAINKKNL